MNRLMQLAGAIRMVLAAQARGPARPEVPESLKAPAGEELILLAHATGVQIYVCQPGADQKFGWLFKAPEAELTDSAGKKVVHHSAGPTWRPVDGSEVTGKVIAKQNAPKPDAIPWLCWGPRVKAERGYSAESRASSESIPRVACHRVQIPAMRPRTAKSRGMHTRPITIFTSLSTEESPPTLRVP